MATHSSILAWRIPQTEEPGYSPCGHERVRYDLETKQQQCKSLRPYKPTTPSHPLSASLWGKCQQRKFWAIVWSSSHGLGGHFRRGTTYFSPSLWQKGGSQWTMLLVFTPYVPIPNGLNYLSSFGQWDISKCEIHGDLISSCTWGLYSEYTAFWNPTTIL